MKKQLFLLACLLAFGAKLLAQDKVNLVIFSEDGDPFYAFVNGVKQNTNPETNVKVTGLSPNISLRIEFENKALPQLKQTMALDPGFEHTARIKRDAKKQLKLRYFGQVPLAEAQAGIPTVAYHATEEPATNYNTAPVNNTNNNVGMNTNVNMGVNGQMNSNTTITSSTTTTTKSNGNGSRSNNENASVNINVGGMGINMNVNGMGVDQDNATIQTTTSTTVTSSHSSSGSMNTQVTEPARPVNPNTNTNPSTNNVSKAGCSIPMNAGNFDKMKQNVESKPFSDTKMSTAKIATKNACLSVNQIKEICKLFSMDDDKLAYAKYAYDYCTEKSNYYEVSEVFSFSSTTDELNSFLEKH